MAADSLSDPDKCGVHVGIVCPVRPRKLSRVDFERCKNTGDQAGQDGRSQDVPAWDFQLLR